MNLDRPLLMIPGPIELHPDVVTAYSIAAPGHLSAPVMQAFKNTLRLMREVWEVDETYQPFVVPGSGTLAMDAIAASLVSPGDVMVQVDTGYFSHRMAEILRRHGAEVVVVAGAPLAPPTLDEVGDALSRTGATALFATHVDTSTGLRTDPEALASLAQRFGALSVFDGVCATAAERLPMQKWGVDAYLTGSQKALGMPPGLALWVCSPAALKRRQQRASPPPMSLDWDQWLPIMHAYEEGRPAYFATPATNLMLAAEVALQHIADDELAGATGIDARCARHARAATALRKAWAALDLTPLSKPDALGDTLSALRYPDGVSAELTKSCAKYGAVVAGGLLPSHRGEYFRVGHMGYSVTRPDYLVRTVCAIAKALSEHGITVDEPAAVAAVQAGLAEA